MFRAEAVIITIAAHLIASGTAIAETPETFPGEVCHETHCCVEFDTPNGGLVECYLKEEQIQEGVEETEAEKNSTDSAAPVGPGPVVTP